MYQTAESPPHLLLTGLALLDHIVLVCDNLGGDFLTGQQLECRGDLSVGGLAGLAGDALAGLAPLHLLAEELDRELVLRMQGGGHGELIVSEKLTKSYHKVITQ